MNFNKKDIVIGFIVIALIIAGVFYFKKDKKSKPVPTNPPVSVTYKEDFENTFKLDIPDNTDMIELKDVSGGNARGIVTETEILVDADEPESNHFYEAWLEKGEVLLPIGRLLSAKGGWLLKFNKTKDMDYDKIVISLEKTNDNKLESRVLEGSF